jgi:hypothetical protein
VIFVADIQRAVADHFGIPLEAMSSPTKQRDYARPRQVAMFLARQLTAQSTTTIGKKFKRDHSTIVNGVQVVQRLCSQDVAFSGAVAWLGAKISVEGRTGNIPAFFCDTPHSFQQAFHSLSTGEVIAEQESVAA